MKNSGIQHRIVILISHPAQLPALQYRQGRSTIIIQYNQPLLPVEPTETAPFNGTAPNCQHALVAARVEFDPQAQGQPKCFPVNWI